MGEFEEKLERILNDPQAMSQIMALAQTFGGESTAPPAAETAPPSESEPFLDPKLLGGIAALMGQYNGNDDQRVALLNALRPFIRQDRYAKLDKAIRIAKLSRMARMALELLRTKEDGHV